MISLMESMENTVFYLKIDQASVARYPNRGEFSCELDAQRLISNHRRGKIQKYCLSESSESDEVSYVSCVFSCPGLAMTSLLDPAQPIVRHGDFFLQFQDKPFASLNDCIHIVIIIVH